MIKALFLILLAASAAVAQVDRQRKPQPPRREIVEVAKCLRVPSTKPHHTSLNCGVDEKGNELVLDIPETVYRFIEGDIFNLYIYSDGQEFPANRQPKGSRIVKTPPCDKTGYRHRPTQVPCNPDLAPKE